MEENIIYSILISTIDIEPYDNSILDVIIGFDHGGVNFITSYM